MPMTGGTPERAAAPLTAVEVGSGRFFENALLHGISSNRAEWLGKEFVDCEFQGCDLEAVEATDCLFDDTGFRDCNLSLARFRNTQLSSCTFRSCKIVGVDWTLARWSLLSNRTTFEDCLLDYCIFAKLSLQNWLFRRCSVREADFSGTVLAGCRFPGTDLSNSRFVRTSFRGAHMEGAFNFAIDVRANDLQGAFFALPEAAALILSLGVELVDPPA